MTSICKYFPPCSMATTLNKNHSWPLDISMLMIAQQGNCGRRLVVNSPGQ